LFFNGLQELIRFSERQCLKSNGLAKEALHKRINIEVLGRGCSLNIGDLPAIRRAILALCIIADTA
jgi:hypothetical protein